MIDVKVAPSHHEAVKRLETLSDELKKKAVASGLTAAARPVKATMKLLAGQETGKLKKSINQLRVSKRAAARLNLFGDRIDLRPGQVAILIGPNKKVGKTSAARVANFLEFGTKPHAIRPKERSLKSFLSLGGKGFAHKVQHPGIKATRFQQRSLDENSELIESLFFEGVSKRIDKLL